MQLKMLLFDIDGVITDGKKYLDSNNNELKSISFKDLDSFKLLKELGYTIGCVTGEDNNFSRNFVEKQKLDYFKLGCKQKENVIQEIEERLGIIASEIAYVGDGKYDIPVLKKVGLSFCPADAIEEVKQVSDIVLKRKGGEGCIAEIYTILNSLSMKEKNEKELLVNRMTEHKNILNELITNGNYLDMVLQSVNEVVKTYENDGQLFLCGNGGSAADAQHLAAELVGRFYLERKALSAEALTVNTSIITSLANDYDYNMIFARQLEAKAKRGDVLIGITTSGTSKNILESFIQAKKMGIRTILMTGYIQKDIEIMKYTDYLLSVPSKDTPRIQEMHILTGHIMCEIIEEKIFSEN